MSSAAASSSITSQIWQRIVRQGDTNGDNSLSKDEFEALRAGFKDSADLDKIMSSLDTNGDGSLSSSELPSSPLDTEMLGPMLSWQEYVKADAATRDENDKQIVAALFKRADVDGDGFLSRDEMKAEGALRQTRWLEGKIEDAIPVISRNVDKDYLSPEDFGVARRLFSELTPPKEIPAELREAVQKVAEELRNSPDYQRPMADEEFRQKLTTSVLNTPLDPTYISRLLSQLSAAITKGDPTNTLRSGTDGTVA